MNIGDPITGIESRFLNKAGIGILLRPFVVAAVLSDRLIVPAAGINVARTMPEPRRDAISRTGPFSR
jgi:hypothetical protein